MRSFTKATRSFSSVNWRRVMILTLLGEPESWDLSAASSASALPDIEDSLRGLPSDDSPETAEQVIRCKVNNLQKSEA